MRSHPFCRARLENQGSDGAPNPNLRLGLMQALAARRFPRALLCGFS